jgi:hypothetical protein
LLLAVALASCSSSKTEKRAETSLPSFQLRLADDIVFEIDPRIELLAGVQSQTSWVKGSGAPQVSGNAYYAELKERFAPLAKGRAARESQWLTNTSFSYDAPCAMVLSLDGGEAFDAPAEGWSNYLQGRAWGAWRLDSFREALAEAYDESKFRDFLAAHEADYRRWLGEEAAGFDGAKISAWLRQFYGAKGDIEFHFVFAPAMFPGGGYGFSRGVAKDGRKRLEVYQIVRAQGSADGQPGFPSGDSLGSLALHEFGHSFVNPALEKGSNDSRLARIFKPVSKVMAKQAYTNASTFLNEMTIRAATIAGERELGMLSDEATLAAFKTERRKGFYPINRAASLLNDYESQRDRYPDFSSYAPVYLEKLASEADAIIAEGAKDDYGSTGARALSPVASFAEDFEGKPEASGLPSGFTLDVGAQSGGGKGLESAYGVDAKAHGDAPGGAALKLEANSGTSVWYCVQKPIAVKKGNLSLSYKAKGENIRTESGQFGGSYVGFIVRYKDGSRRFAVQTHSGSFEWQGFSLAEGIDPAKVDSIMFTAFLNESGALWVDDLAVEYEK